MGSSGKAGLTSDVDGTGTKKLDVLVATALAPITLADLRAKGLIPD
jgi:hypothetical protein